MADVRVMSQQNIAPKICFVTSDYPPDIGGVAKSSDRIVQFFAQEGFEVHIFAPAGKKLKTFDTVKRQNLHRIQTTGTIEDVHAFSQAIERIDKEVSFDIFHGFFLPMAYPCIEIAKKRNKPLIGSIRGSDVAKWLYDARLGFYIQKVLQNTDWITSNNTELLQKADDIVPLRHKSSVIFNTIEAKNFPRWQITENNRGVVGTVAEFTKKKNIPLLVESYSRIPSDLRKKLLLVGEFSEEAALLETKEVIKRNNLDSEFELTGLVNNHKVPEYHRAMRVFVNCSTNEGLPNAVLEAAASGIPLITTNVGGMKDIFEDNVSTLMISPNDPQQLATALERILRDDNLAQRLSKGAVQVSERLKPEHEKKAWIDLYRKFLG